MNIVDIIVNADGGEKFRMSEPSLSEAHHAYEKWMGVVIEKCKLSNAIVVRDPKGTAYKKDTVLGLSGVVVDSEWEKVVE